MSDANIDPSAQVSVTNRETQEKWAIDQEVKRHD